MKKAQRHPIHTHQSNSGASRKTRPIEGDCGTRCSKLRTQQKAVWRPSLSSFCCEARTYSGCRSLRRARLFCYFFGQCKKVKQKDSYVANTALPACRQAGEWHRTNQHSMCHADSSSASKPDSGAAGKPFVGSIEKGHVKNFWSLGGNLVALFGVSEGNNASRQSVLFRFLFGRAKRNKENTSRYNVLRTSLGVTWGMRFWNPCPPSNWP